MAGARLRAFFGGRAARRPAGHSFSSERFLEARTLVRAFYAALLFLAVADLFRWGSYLDATHLEPRWPVFWLRWVDARLGISLVLWLYLIGGLAGVTLHGYRWARILVFVARLEFIALTFSYGSINHGAHLGLLLSFVLIFLPRGWGARPSPPRAVRAATLLAFSACQGMILLIYSMSGLWKVVGTLRQMVAGEVSYLSPEGLAQQVAAKLLEADTVAPLGPFLIEHYWLGPPLAAASIYLELFALWVVLRPSLHQAWGLGLILFHLSTQLTMGIAFMEHALWLSLFLVFSPFRPARWAWRDALRDLPAVGWLLDRTRLGG